jgi:hypothetical protein
MSKRFWQTIALGLGTLLTTLLLLIGYMVNHQAIALPQIQHMTQVSSADQLSDVTSIDRLLDVIPSDYYYPALQNLIEKYACISGNRDRYFRAERPIVRAEVVGQIVTCLDRETDLVAASTAELATSEDLLTTRRLLEQLSQESDALQEAK